MTKQELATPVIDIETIVLEFGSHAAPEDGVCFMEAYAVVYKKPFTDRDPSVSPAIASFCRSWNDSLDKVTRQRLKVYLPRVKDTAGDGYDERRGWMCIDWLSRECAAAFLDLNPSLKPHADSLRGLPEIKDNATLAQAQPLLTAAWDTAGDAARDAAWAAAWAAARAAAWDTAGAAARAAAWDAAGATARAAAWDTAGDAARDAAWAAAWAAARAAAWDTAGRTLAPTVLVLQESAFSLLDRMCDLGSGVEVK